MSLARSEGAPRPGVVFVGPATDSEGGIAMVLKNYGKTHFWSTFDCTLYPTSAEHDSGVASFWYQARQLLQFLPWLLSKSPRVVSIHTSSRRSFYRSFVYLLLARLSACPVVLHVHPVSFVNFHAQGGRVLRWLIKVAIEQSDQVIVLSDGIRDAFAPIAHGRKVIVVPNPVDLSEYSYTAAKSAPAGGLVVLYMGWIIREKGVYDLVDAIPAVIKAIPGTRFVFAGNKETERLATMLRERGLESVATVAGWVSGNEKLALLRDSHLLVLPSYSEGVPNVLLEAMASGLPVLTTPVGGIPSLVDNGKTGLFTAPGDVAALTSNTIKLLADPDLRQQLAVAARARIEASCSLERVGHLLSDTYARYIDSNAKHVVNESSPT